MRLLTRSHIILITAGIIAIVLLSFARTTPKPGATKAGMPGRPGQEEHQHSSMEQQLAEARKRLSPELMKKVNFYQAAIDSERDAVKRGHAYDSLSMLLGRSKEFALGAWYAEEKARRNNGTAVDWQVAGERWYAAVQFARSEDERAALYESAAGAFEKALELNPANLKAKTGLGVCYVEATNDPMKGITLLREVLEADPANVDALFNMAMFAERSQQYDKAIERYESILKLHPEYIMIWLKMAEVYQATGDKANTIRCLESYLKVETDPVMRNSIENDLNKLKSNN